MLAQKQKFRHDPENGVFGDCFRTVLACLLDMPRDDVPHFFDGLHDAAIPDDKQKAVRDWLLSKGYGKVAVAFDSKFGVSAILNVMGTINCDVLWMLSGRSETGCNHVVICRGGEIIHDPSLTDAGIIGPCDDGFFWAEFLVPASQIAGVP